MASGADRRAPAAASADPPGRSRRRVRSVDVLRGLVLAVMLWTPPIDGDAYRLLIHAEWTGWTLSDLIFPTFLFTSGLSLSFLLRTVTPAVRLRLARRTIALLLLGLLYNALGGPLDLASLRVTGVLQLIGIAGAVAAGVVLLARRAGRRAQHWIVAGTAAGLLIVHGAVQLAPASCVPEPGCSPAHAVDLAVLGAARLYRGGVGVAYDPEGVVVSVVAASLVLAGWLAGRLIVARTALQAAGWAALAGVVGLLVQLSLSGLLPVSKRLLTPTFVVLAASLAALVLALLLVAADAPVAGRAGRTVEAMRRVALWPFVTLGWNALVVFFSERILLLAAQQTTLGDRTLAEAVMATAPGWIGPPLWLSGTLLAVVLAITAAMRLLRWRVVL